MPASYVQVYIHLVWATWDRLPILKPGVRDSVYACISSACSDLRAKAMAIGGTNDHVHLLVSMPATTSIAELAKKVKGSSSHLVNHRGCETESFKWQGSYAAFSVSKALVPVVRSYVLSQEEHHRAGTTDRDAELSWEDKEAGPFAFE
jgi:putative transposase